MLRTLKASRAGASTHDSSGTGPGPSTSSTRLQTGHFSAQRPFMIPLSLWTKANFTICSQPPFPDSSSHTFLLEIASNSMPQAQQIIYCFRNIAHTLLESCFMIFLLSGLPHSASSILLLLLMFIFDISFLPKTFPDLPDLSWELHPLPFQCFLGPCLYLYKAFIYSSKEVLIFYVPSTIQRSWWGIQTMELIQEYQVSRMCHAHARH